MSSYDYITISGQITRGQITNDVIGGSIKQIQNYQIQQLQLVEHLYLLVVQLLMKLYLVG